MKTKVSIPTHTKCIYIHTNLPQPVCGPHVKDLISTALQLTEHLHIHYVRTSDTVGESKAEL